MNRAGVIVALAGVLMFGSAAGIGAGLNESDRTPWHTLELSLLETNEALRVAHAALDDTQLMNLEAFSNLGGTNVPYVRPDRSRPSFCGDCELQVGLGGTYHSFEATGGEVIPVTLTWDRGRWEFGVFHFGEQTSTDNSENVERLVARPYWGASMSRRFKLFERGPLRAIFGFGLSYRTETDVLSATHWNFSSQFGLRYQLSQFPAVVELSARHWSNGGVRTPNRGQDFTILTVRFDR
ncbi:MAG TPA: acyloxyacyl hydrolase [Steroidobacteraceae bacterium]|nr:acyloxyacyl hydrolase [Steroidobacteraceae bacterium]